jgi:hypothetical protein
VDGERSVAWAGRRAITVFGVVTVVFWLSFAVFPRPIPPLVPLPDVSGVLKEMVPWIRQQDPALNRPDADVLASVRRDIVVILARTWLQVAAGVASGLLIARRRRSGRALAIALCGALLGFFLLSQGRHIWNHHLVALWTALAQHLPLTVLRWVIDVLFCVGTLAYLTRRQVAVQFARRE